MTSKNSSSRISSEGSPVDGVCLLVRFVEFLRYERRYSRHTELAYREDVENFFAFARPGEPIDSVVLDVSREDVRGWVADQIANGAGPRSVNRRLSGVRYFFRYLRQIGVLSHDPSHGVGRVREPRRLPTYLQPSEASRLFDRVDFPEGFLGARDRLLLLLLYALGLRRGEVIALRWSDFSRDYGQVVVHGKGDKDRTLPVLGELAELIGAYALLSRERFGASVFSGFVLRTESGANMTGSQVYHLVRRYLGSVTSQSNCGPHVLRHSFATHMLSRGADIVSIKELLGHSSLDTTQVYTHVDSEVLRAAYNRSHPHARFSGGVSDMERD